jgi:hypothetical protein
MADVLKQEPKKLRVLQIRACEGGLELPELGTVSYLTAATAEQTAKAPHPSALTSLSLELEQGRGVLVSYRTRDGKPQRWLIPLAHLRQIKLEPDV